MSLVEYGNQLVETRSVWYNGTTALRQGQPLFYLDDAATGVVVPDTITAGVAAAKNTRIGQVVDGISATGAHMSMFAGIPSDAHVGLTGPRNVDIITPKKGDVLQIEVTNNAAITKNVSMVVPATTADAPAFTTKATPVAVDTVFLALQTVAINAGTPGTGDTRSVIWAINIK